MKTILHIFLVLIPLLCASCLCAHTSFAAETETAQVKSSPAHADKVAAQADNALENQNKTISSNTLTNQDTKKQFPQHTAAAENPFPSSQETIPSFGWGNYFQGIGLMLLLLFAFWYILKLMRKYGNGRFLPNQKLLPRDSMYLEGQLPLGQGKSILIVKVLDERLVLGVTEKNINLLSKTGINHAETFEELMQQVPSQNTPDA